VCVCVCVGMCCIEEDLVREVKPLCWRIEKDDVKAATHVKAATYVKAATCVKGATHVEVATLVKVATCVEAATGRIRVAVGDTKVMRCIGW
jgi:hypothetical protein